MEPNPITSIKIPGFDVEYFRHVHKKKIDYPSRIEEIDEEISVYP
jgi:hypothetical protein